jgi:hypothetical protein
MSPYAGTESRTAVGAVSDETFAGTGASLGIGVGIVVMAPQLMQRNLSHREAPWK